MYERCSEKVFTREFLPMAQIRRLKERHGDENEKIYGTHYLPSDFKKNKGYERSIQMCKEYDIFRQCYCGCVFAAKQQGCVLKKINQEAKDYLASSKISIN